MRALETVKECLSVTRRRGHNEGSIYQEADGRWRAALVVGRTPEGRLKRKKFSGRTRREVQEKLTAAMRDQQLGVPVAGNERQTVAQFLGRWLELSKRPKVRPRVFENYAGIVRNHIIPELGHIPLRKLTPQRVQAFVNLKLESDLSEYTVKNIRGVLRSALNQGLRWNDVAMNAAALTDGPKTPSSSISVFTLEQSRSFLDGAKGHRLEAAFIAAIVLGLRRGELLGLKWNDVDFESDRLTVRGSLQRVAGGGLVVLEPKTDSSRRDLVMPVVLSEALRRWRVHQLEERLLAGDRWTDSGFVFTSAVGTPIEPRNFTRSFKQLLVKLGLPELRLHDLRHSCASLLLAQGATYHEIRDALGHSRVSTTMDIYVHSMPEAKRGAADRMDALFGQVG